MRTIAHSLALICLFACSVPAAQMETGSKINERSDHSNTIRPIDSSLVHRFVEDGKLIDEVVVGGRPPEDYQALRAQALEVDSGTGINILQDVPAFEWSYGCSATAAAMLMGYYDRHCYINMYAGQTNGGVCPLDNSVWGYTMYPGVTCQECPLSATHLGVDGRSTRGHVEDYWIDFLDPGPDPYTVNGWPEHSQGECVADYMGTNQSRFALKDGQTWFYFYTNGSPCSDYQWGSYLDGCHGMRLFAESRGYLVTSNFNQYIQGYNGNSLGFTFDQYCSEIDAGRPVLIQVENHTMLGYGYNRNGNIVYVHNGWDYYDHTMTWGGDYSDLQHYGVTTLRLASAPVSPTIVVSNVTARQRIDGSKKVDIRYDLICSQPTTCNISLKLSDDGGSSYTSYLKAVSDDTGNVSTGVGKYVVWDAGSELPGAIGSTYKIMITATSCNAYTGVSGTFPIDNRNIGVPTAYDVKSPQGKHFIPGMPGTLKFQADVNWNGSPGTVCFTLNGTKHQATVTDLGSGNARAEVTVPAPHVISNCSEVIVEVTNAVGKTNVVNGRLYFHPVPQMIQRWYGDNIPWGSLSGTMITYGDEYSQTFWDVSDPSGVLNSSAEMGFGKQVSFDAMSGMISGSLTASGTYTESVEFEGVENISEGTLAATGNLTATFAGCGTPKTSTSLELSAAGKAGIGFPVVRTMQLFPAATGPIEAVLKVPVLKDLLLAPRLRCFFLFGGSVSGEFNDTYTGPCYYGTTGVSGAVTFGLEGQVAAKIRSAEVGVYIGGTGTPSWQWCPDFQFEGLTGRGYVGVFASAWLFHYKQEVGTELRWFGRSPAQANTCAVAASAGEYSVGKWEPIGSSCLEYGGMNRLSSTGSPRTTDSLSSPQSSGSAEETIVQNVTKLSGPSIIADSQECQMLFPLFDPNKPWYAATDIASVFGSSSWSQNRVTDDQLAEFSPRLTAVDANTALATWTRVTGDISNTTDPSQVAPYLDIVATHLDRKTGTWGIPEQITTNGVVDRDPLPVVFGSNQGIIWVQNEADAALGNSRSGDRLMYSRWSGSVWSSPQVLWSAEKGIIGTAFVADSSGEGHVVFAADEDGDLDIRTDRELYQVSTSGGTWGSATRLTNDNVEDSLSTLVAPNGTPICVWNAGGTLKYTPLSLWNPRVVYSKYTISNEAATLDGITMPDGAAIAYAVQLPTGVDIVASFYDANLDIWSLPRQLTNDADVETALSLGFDGSQFVIGYLKNRTVRGPVDVEIDGQMQHLEGIPQPSQTDLCVLTHTLGSDLAAGAIKVDPANPIPGSAATITLAVENRGDLPESDIEVAFFDGDPLSGGVQIGSTQNIAEPLVAGKSADVSVSWNVPADDRPHKLYAVVDQNLSVDDRDRANNTGYIWVLGPDASVSTPQLISTAGTQMVVQAQINNTGQYSAPAVPWEIRLDDAQGTLLSRGTTDAIAAGESTVISATLDTAGMSEDSATIYVVADPQQTIADSDYSNNVSMSTIVLLPDIAVNQGSASLDGNNVTLTLSNQGVRETGSFVVRATREDSLVLGQISVSSILPGGQVDVTVPITPGLVYTGIALTANPDGTVAEAHTDNNSAFVFASNYATIGAVRSLADGTRVLLSNKVVTANLDRSFYIEESDRSAGIKIIYFTPPDRNSKVTITGQVMTQGAERVIFADSVTPESFAEVKPVGISLRNLGGHLGNPVWLGFSDQAGLSAVYNLGLLVRVWGRIAYVDSSGAFAYIDDGSMLDDGNTLGSSGSPITGAKVILPSGVSMPPVGAMVVLTGVASSETTENVPRRVLRIRSQQDIWKASSTICQIVGRVMDMDSTSIAHATVIAQPGDHSTTTDSLGNYVIDVLPGSYTVTASKPGYSEQAFRDRVVSAGADTVVNFDRLKVLDNMLVNPTFETGALTPWVRFAGASGGFGIYNAGDFLVPNHDNMKFAGTIISDYGSVSGSIYQKVPVDNANVYEYLFSSYFLTDAFDFRGGQEWPTDNKCRIGIDPTGKTGSAFGYPSTLIWTDWVSSHHNWSRLTTVSLAQPPYAYMTVWLNYTITSYHPWNMALFCDGFFGRSQPVICIETVPSVSSVSELQATISWETNAACNTRVDYGTTASYGLFTLDESATKTHSAVITGLEPSTTYHFKVTSGGSGYVPDSSSDYTFTTQP